MYDTLTGKKLGVMTKVAVYTGQAYCELFLEKGCVF